MRSATPAARAGKLDDAARLRELRRRLAAEGFFRGGALGYWVRAGGSLIAFILCYLAGLRASGLLSAAAALGTAFFGVQLGIVAHEAGHGSIGRRWWMNELAGQLGMSLVNGLGFSHWRHHHDRHHRRSQVDGEDPDMRFSMALSVTPRDAASRPPSIARWQRYQAVYFWLLSPFFAWSLRVDSITTAARGELPGSRIDRAVLAAHYALWLALPAALGSPAHAALQYLLYTTLLSLYIMVLFTTNHLGLEVIERGAARSYLRQQIEHTRNVRVPRSLDFVFGGLNFHVEHHLFPRVPGHRLRRGSATVAAFCREHGLAYHSHSHLEAVAQIHEHLSGVTRHLRLPEPAAAARQEGAA